MKKLLLTFTIIIAALFSMAQAPYMMNYQGVARNATGNVFPNKSIGLRLSILTGSATGPVVYSETRTVLTNAFGLFNIQVGGPGASNVTGTIAGVNWAQSGTKFLQVEIDPDGGTNFVNVGSTQLLSTPFTMYANVSGDLILPFTKTQAENGHLFKVTNTGNTGSSSAVEGLTTSTAANAYAIKGTISSTAPGTLAAGIFGQNNGNGASGVGVMGQHNGNGWGVYGTATGGSGVYGSSTTGNGVYGQSVTGNSIAGFQPSNGTGNAGLFQNTNAANASANILSSSNGTGDGIRSLMNGTGKAASLLIDNPASNSTVLTATTNGTGTTAGFQNTNGANNSVTLDVTTNGTGDASSVTTTGTGKAASLTISNATNGSTVLAATTNGTGTTGSFTNTNAGNNSPVVNVATNGTGNGAVVNTTGTGKAASLTINNAANSSDVLTATTNGTGTVGNLSNTNAANASTVLAATTNGTGSTGSFSNTNTANNSAVVNIATNGAGDGALVTATGTGKAASLIINNVANSSNVLNATTNGTGIVGNLSNTNAANSSTALNVTTNGTGTAGNFSNTNNANGSTALNVATNGTGDGATVTATGTGKAASILINNAANSSTALTATTNGSGIAGSFANTNALNNSNVVSAVTNGLGRSGYFQNTNSANTSSTLDVLTNGTGFAANITNTNGAAKALRTQGALQFTGIGEAANKVMSTDAAGNATWQFAAAVGIVSGSGTSNYLPKWLPSGTALGNTQVFDDGTNVGINNNAPNYKLDILATGADDGLRLRTTNTNNLRLRMANSTGKEFSLLVGGSGSGFGNGNFLINDATGDANRFLINGGTGNIAIGGGNLTPAEKLWVNGTGRFKNNLDVEKSIHVTDSMLSARLKVTGNSSTYLALFENTNTADGDGIQIKLGKTNPMWDGSAWVGVPLPTMPGLGDLTGKIKGWAYGDPFNITDMIQLSPSTWVAGTVASLTNYVTDQINGALHLPYKIGPYGIPAIHIWNEITVFPGLDLGLLGSIPALKIPALDIPATQVIPEVTVMPEIPDIPVIGLPALTWPNLRTSDVTNSLTKNNEFISFTDKDGRSMGAIRAQSISNFYNDYFDHIKIAELMDQMVGIDLLKDIFGVFAGIMQIAKDFNNIGVEYASGHGDYAEWLERENENEIITAGDIVGVKGGKITKDLKDAEQIMAVSHKPIVLGNMPEKEKVSLGNNVAFMGQVPVKIMGPVTAGDYIVAKGDIAGYGVAVHPKNMSIEDHKLVVGRSWASNDNAGPKVVNTVVGVVNNGFLNIISDLKKKAETTDSRLKAIEESLLLRSATIKNNTKNN